MGKWTEQTAITEATSDDLALIVNDPGGTPASRKITIANLLKKLFTSDGTQLTIDAAAGIADGEYLKRSGTTITGDTPSSGGTDADFERFFEIVAPPGGTTRLNVGIGAYSITTPGTGPTSADDADGVWNSWTTGASSGNEINAGPASFSQFRKEWGGAYIFRVKTGAAITNVRIWIGLGSADPAGSATPNGNYAMFGYDTGVDGDAFWRTYTDDSAASEERQTTTQSIAVDTAYTFKIVPSASDTKFYVWSGSAWTLLTTHTTKVPGGAMGTLFVCKTLTASDKTFKFSFFRGRHK